MELTESEIRMVLEARRERAASERRAASPRPQYPVTVMESGTLRVTKESDSHHTPWGVYDGERLVCFCLYRRGAIALVDYINNIRKGGDM